MPQKEQEEILRQCGGILGGTIKLQVRFRIIYENTSVVDGQFVRQQNRFRGLIAEYKSRRFVENRKVPPASRFRSGLSNLLLELRAVLRREQYRPILEWISEMTVAQLGDITKLPIGYDNLSGIFERAPTVPLEDDLLWIAERIRIERSNISAFLAAKATVERSTLAGRYPEAIRSVEQIQSSFGVTLWSVQLRLALEHQTGGLERQKRYCAEVRGIYRTGLLGFVAYHSSVRNEDRTTFAKYLSDIERRIENNPYFSDDAKVYMRYRLKGEHPIKTNDIAKILKIEQNHGVIDVYETFVSVLQHIASRQIDKKLSDLISKCISKTLIDDFRLIKIMNLLDSTVSSQLPSRDCGVSNKLLHGDAKLAAELSLRELNGTSRADPWALIYGGFALAHRQRTRNLPSPQPAAIEHMIGRIQSRWEASEDAWEQTAKLALNYGSLPVAKGVLEFLNQLRRVKPDTPWRPWLIGLNSPTCGVEDRAWNHRIKADPATPTDPTSDVWNQVFLPEKTPRQAAATLARALALLWHFRSC